MPLVSSLTTVLLFVALGLAILGELPAFVAVAVAAFVWEAALTYASNP